METFESMWSSSRQNEWTDIYLYVIAGGVFALVALSFIRNGVIRRTLKVLAALGFAFGTGEASFQAINRKWQIRHEWTDKHYDTLTEEQRMVSISDGANLVFGPLQEVFLALVCFTITILILTCIRPSFRKQNSTTGAPEKLQTTVDTSENAG